MLDALDALDAPIAAVALHVSLYIGVTTIQLHYIVIADAS